MSDEQAIAEVVVNEPEAILEPTEAVDPNLLDSEEPEAQEAIQDSEETLDKKDPWYKKRIDELTRDKHEARRQSERLEKLLEQQEQMLKQFAPKNESQAPKLAAPDPNDFAGGQYDPRYMDAMLQYTRVSAVEEAKAAVAAEYEQRAATQTAMAAQAKLEIAETAARAKFADYDTVIEGIISDPRLAQNPTIRQALLGLDNGPEIAYMLGRNLDVAYEIAGLDNPIAAGMKLAEIINRAPRAKFNAPTPIKPLNGAAGGVPRNVKNYAEMTTVEYIAARNAEDLAKKQAMMRR
jgi:hypothetical protein